MRQTIGATWILQLVIVFMLIFVAFLALSINYTKAFKIKNEILAIIEKYEGVSTGDNGSIAIINNYLKYNGYRTVGTCDEMHYGVSDLDSASISPVSEGKKYYYCVSKTSVSNATFPDRASYQIETFFKFNLPLLGDIFTFRVSGVTIDINWPDDDLPASVIW